MRSERASARGPAWRGEPRAEPQVQTEIVKELGRYLVVGGLAFLVDFGVLVLLTELAGLHYLSSAAVGFCLGATLNYALCRAWVFKTRRVQNATVEFGVFVAIGVVGLGVNELVLWACTGGLLLPYQGSKLVATAVVLGWNFAARKVVLF